MDERILIVEDDPSIRETTAIGLEAAGFRVREAPDGREALERFRQEPFDLVGLELGADDYVTKPFELPELVARIRAALRRASSDAPGERLLVGNIEIDPEGFRVRKGGVDLDLTATEFRLLLELARRPGQVFTRELLLDLVWNYEYLGDSRLVDVAVQRLRAKIEDEPGRPELIVTVRGVGYRFEKP